MHNSLDMHTQMPEDMAVYLSNNGFHFSHKAYEYALKDMREQGYNVAPMKKEEVEELFAKYGITVKGGKLYDVAYKFMSEKAYHYGKSLPNEQFLAMHVAEDMDKKGATGEEVFRCWIAERIGDDNPIDWHAIL